MLFCQESPKSWVDGENRLIGAFLAGSKCLLEDFHFRTEICESKARVEFSQKKKELQAALGVLLLQPTSAICMSVKRQQ